MSNISDYPLSFRLVRDYVVCTFKRYYGEYIVVGRENIPAGCPVIFAPNHINALMDAIAVHSIAPYKLPVIFLARADLFKDKTAAKLLNFVKILPAFRMRDGMENLGKNSEVFEQCVGILHQNKGLGIMPEGNQGEERKLRPLVKGIFRIAFTAQQPYGTQPKVKIIPVGIDYGDLVKYGKHVIINIGKPIEISEYMKSYGENPVTATNDIRERLTGALNRLSLDLASAKHYSCFETVTAVANSSFVEKLHFPDNTVYRFIARQEIAKTLVALEESNPEKIDRLESLCKEYTGLLTKVNLRNWVLEQKPYSIPAMLVEGFKLFWTIPFFVFGFLLNFIPFFLPVYIRKKIIKAEYEGFFSSLQFGIGIIAFPVFYLLQAILFCSLANASWKLTLIFFFVQYPLGKWAIKWNREAKRFMAKRRYLKLLRKKSTDLARAQSVREQIIGMIL
ncbi:MAG: 1-acyl-sn-glycerol-3-phosphate acyltransferase [Bacteroidota bacterium]|nr:1-acyl-sn-glycerol-3-phosphate acyltransferase [Bacteroidota bacterium]